ncbi:unnamed protein product [Arctia plantaginis]|uniref:Peptidase S1 domain-containing protein n=1 Tax=Arctia plantaginis TaxID=874455 RepID=A0A8S0ZYT3_ARCPL|nr:unnamed protein product [Arctia plantaginis]
MDSCVFEPGMALVYYAEGKFSLMGISAWGPGCSLPARYIDFEPFVPWIMSKLAKRPTRKAWKMDEMDELELERKGRDRWMLERITDEKGLTLRPLDPNTAGDMEKEVVHGKCDDLTDGELIYREVTEFSDMNPSLNMRLLAVYALSLYNLNFDRSNYTCVQVLAKCKQKSDSQLEFTKGFGEHSPLDPYIKRIPIPQSSFQKDVYKPYIHTVKEHWATYNYEILGSEITHLIFRFEFETNAQFEVDFFGKHTEPTTESTSTTTTEKVEVATTPRKLRPHTTVTVTTPAPDYYYDGWWFVKGPKTSTNGTTTTTAKTKKTTNTAYWWNHWWHFNEKDHKEWWKG